MPGFIHKAPVLPVPHIKQGAVKGSKDACATLLLYLHSHDALRVPSSDGALDGPAEDGLVIQRLHSQEAQDAIQVLQAVLQRAQDASYIPAILGQRMLAGLILL